MKDVGGADKLPTARFFGATWPVRKAAQNDTLFGIFDPANRAHKAAQNDTLFQSEKEKVIRQKGAEYLPAARFFDRTGPAHTAAQNDTLFGIEHLPATRFFDPAIPIRKAAQNDTLFGVEYLPTGRFFGRTKRTHRAAQNDTLFQNEKAKVKRQKGLEYLPATRFFDRTRPVRKAAQNDTLFGRVEHLPATRFFDPAMPVHRAVQNDTLFGTLREKIQSIYTAEIGIRESTGKNDGTRIEEYLAYVGLAKGNPWCAAFVCWVYGKAGVENPRSGWSPALFPESRIIWSRSRGLIQHSSFSIQHSEGLPIKHSTLSIQHSKGPRAADIFGIWFQDKKRIAHCGFIDDWQEKYVITVEGNTNKSGSREGDGIYRKRRLISTVYKVARWVG